MIRDLPLFPRCKKYKLTTSTNYHNTCSPKDNDIIKPKPLIDKVTWTLSKLSHAIIVRKYIIFDILLHNMDEDLSFGPLDPTSHNTNVYLYAPAKPALNIAAATCSHILCFIYLSSPLPPLQQQRRKKKSISCFSDVSKIWQLEDFKYWNRDLCYLVMHATS